MKKIILITFLILLIGFIYAYPQPTSDYKIYVNYSKTIYYDELSNITIEIFNRTNHQMKVDKVDIIIPYPIKNDPILISSNKTYSKQFIVSDTSTKSFLVNVSIYNNGIVIHHEDLNITCIHWTDSHLFEKKLLGKIWDWFKSEGKIFLNWIYYEFQGKIPLFAKILFVMLMIFILSVIRQGVILFKYPNKR